jgi:hypothetical protein
MFFGATEKWVEFQCLCGFGDASVYRFRRFAWLRSMPESNAPNSAAVISRRFSPLITSESPNGIA